MLQRYFGDRKFYARVLALTMPIMIQNGITNLVNMVDNIMVGRVGTLQMTGVAVANQLMFVFNLCIFGAVSGAGIFVAQYFGRGNHQGIRETFRFKMLFCLGLTLLGIGVFWFCGEPLIHLYLKGDGNTANAQASLSFAADYLNIMLIGLLPYTVVQCFSSTLRETGKSVPPMVAGVIAVGVNLGLNYILIFGHFGAPCLGVRGAAIATVISRFAELIIVVLWTVRNRQKNQFIIGAFKSLSISRELIRQIIIKGLPLMINESLWAAGIAVLNQCYSIRGLDVVSATNITQTFFNVFSVAFMAVGVAIGIILGQLLGANKMQEAQNTARRLIAFSLIISLFVAAAFFICARFIPNFYNTTDAIKHTATGLMSVCALAMPLDAVANACYFTLRSGGKTLITFLFDSCFVWLINVPSAFILSRYTALPILALYAICQFESLLKDILGLIFVKKGVWVRNIVQHKKNEERPKPAETPA